MSQPSSPPPVAVDTKPFRNALGSFATGVTIVTTRDGEGRDVGLTANSFNSVSLDPPMVLWSLARSSGSLDTFMQAGHFAVHILAAGQQALSDRFARRGSDKFAGLALERGSGEVPLLEGCSARFQCRTAFRYEGGDHMIFVGEVVAFDHFNHPPLVFHSGRYGKVLPRPAELPATAGEVESSLRKDFLGYLLGYGAMQLYRPVRAAASARGLDDCGYFVLTLLAAGPERTVGEIDRLIAISGQRLTPTALQHLLAAGLVSASGEGDAAVLVLTAAGRRCAIELFAIAKAAEETAVHELDDDDARLLKDLLKRVIRSTGKTA